MIRQDLRYAIRRLGRDRGFAVAAILILAVAIGACTAMFSIVRAVLLRSLAVDAPERVVMMWTVDTRQHVVGELTYSTRRALLQPLRSFADVALMGAVNWSGVLSLPGAEPVSLACNAVSGTFFDVLGARPLLGRTLSEADDQPGAAPVMVLSHAAWTQYFGGDRGILGRKVPIAEGRLPQPFEVIGVMPPDFFFPRGAQYWTAAAPALARLAAANTQWSERQLFENVGVFYALGRLKPEADLAAARDEGTLFLQAEAQRRQVDLSSHRLQLTPLLDHVFGNARRALMLLMAAVAMVLLIACGNVAGLLLARGASRTREVALRAALGASRWALVRQMLMESALIVGVASAAGVLAASLGLDALVSLSPADIPRLDTAAIDGVVLAFAVASAALTTVAVGLIPATRLSRPALIDDIKGAGTGARPENASARRWLLGMQVAGTLVLLVAAGLCVRSFARLNALDLGFNPRHVLTFSIVGLDDERYPAKAARHEAIEEILARLERLPDVVHAGAVLLRPFEHGPIGMDSGVLPEGLPDTPGSWVANPLVNWESVAGRYFEAMNIPLLAGRTFEPGDTAAAPPVTIVSAATASRLWPGQDPLGKRLRLSLSEDKHQWVTVVGVVGTARYREIETPRLDLYVPLRQAQSDVQHFVVRTRIDPTALVAGINAEVGSSDKALSLGSVMTLEAIVRRTQGPWRFNMLVFGLFGGVALALAAVGLFALVAWDVARRSREIALRMALGAARGDVVRMMIWQGARPSAIGGAAGIAVALVATRVLSQFLFEIQPTDPVTFTGVVCVLTMVIVLATYLPARRAAAIDPLVVLKE